MLVLGIESSCDDTAAAVVKDGREVLSSVVASQVKEHIVYGGVVPEIASRLHAEAISAVVEQALSQANVTIKDIDYIAVTYAPGLIGALLVGVNFAKGLSFATGIPLVPVHHLRAHIASNYISDKNLKPPFICLVVSGGHSHIVRVNGYTDFAVIGKTQDDAAGECMDKAARTMGLPYPGGLNLDKFSAGGDAEAFKFPNPKLGSSKYDFSFSGLKTSVINLIHNAQQKGTELNFKDVGASFINSVTDYLLNNSYAAIKDSGLNTLVIAGGVSANSVLREKAVKLCRETGVDLYFPELKYCGDNGAMVAAQGFYEAENGNFATLDLNAFATMPIDEK